MLWGEAVLGSPSGASIRVHFYRTWNRRLIYIDSRENVSPGAVQRGPGFSFLVSARSGTGVVGNPGVGQWRDPEEQKRSWRKNRRQQAEPNQTRSSRSSPAQLCDPGALTGLPERPTNAPQCPGRWVCV